VDFKKVFIDHFEQFCNGGGTYEMDEGGLGDCINNDPSFKELPID